MSNEIRNLSGRAPPGGAPVGRAPRSATAGVRGAATSRTAEDRVTLTGRADQIQSIIQGLEAVPVVDMGRVTSVRESLASNTYQVDSLRVADAIIKMEMMLPNLSYGDAYPA
jgi:flagellar biosynthesis anti-sigma factor FlgM